MFDATPSPDEGLPLDAADLDLIEAARAALLAHYRPFWHTVSAAIRGRDGRIWTGIHLGATVGRLSICAEAVAFGRAVMEGDGTIATAVALRHPKPDETDRVVAVVSPCGACREMITDYAPDALVIVPGLLAPAQPVKLPIRALLPRPYQR
ncbi:MAG TPA: cytidine deaminase [Acetobacteraceae bacterium]|nr:cytidine deaminase [Acetobacteraceae bacterium]